MMEILTQIAELAVPVILGLAASFLIKLINQKTEESKEKTDSERKKKYLDLFNATITDCIKATNQTYVNALKEKNMFDADAQKEALRKTTNSVMNILKGDAEEYLREALGDLDALVQEKIEANIEEVKK